MPYSNTLHFVQKMLRELNLKSYVLTEPFAWNPAYDNGLRKSILTSIDSIATDWPRKFTAAAKQSIIVRATDAYHCEYICVRLSDNPGLTVMLIGPFTYEKMSNARVTELCNELKIPGNLTAFMHRYYQTLPFVSDERWIKGLVRNLAEEMWTAKEIPVSVYGAEQLVKQNYNVDHPSPTPNDIHRLELRYANEALLMNAIANGDLTTIDQMLEGGKVCSMKQHFTDTLRDKKNDLLIFNTLCRKAAENGQIHVVYVDEVFEKNIFEIERTTSIEQLNKMGRSIVREYCLLVQSHSLKGFSQPIRQAINYISFHLTDDLSLSAMAEYLMLNGSYLSTLFKKETGMTLTYYVNQKRVEHAIFLLNTTALPIQDIAVLCGIRDLNYFTKTFKKYKNMAPTEYREMLRGRS